MHLPSALCRAQETAQRERAANTTLANVREAAERAAAAWNREAIAAKGRERREKSRLDASDVSDVVPRLEGQHIEAPSENPDRGFAVALSQ
ncbi:hypothetical protein [Sphingomonas nostoxanthinifaciens]|uniref:hypothetical protein n=1 Tax=Sphingomonas nostoxanthinifaciens TaxID=2872652 RepID=UPI001CC1EDFC|nr:hypothetical protein [Sphingomonas nostoxanthinifaciens]UAK26097.1 hypothetical protein K8P63_08335 [Sphingomonas nostoxanthinifaciens]